MAKNIRRAICSRRTQGNLLPWVAVKTKNKKNESKRFPNYVFEERKIYDHV